MKANKLDEYKCSICKIFKHKDRFTIFNGKNQKVKVCFDCQEKNTTKDSEWLNYSADKSRLKLQYGITIEDYNNLFINQEGRCAICGVHQSSLKKKLSVDHCHKTGKVRGLLCTDCNHGLGKFKDNSLILLTAADYLKR